MLKEEINFIYHCKMMHFGGNSLFNVILNLHIYIWRFTYKISFWEYYLRFVFYVAAEIITSERHALI